MGQINSIAKSQRPDSKKIYVRMEHVFDEIEEDVRNGRVKLTEYKKRQNVSERDVNIFQQTLQELKGRYRDRMEYLDPKKELGAHSKGHPKFSRVRISFHEAIDQLETECKRWPDLIQNMKDNYLGREQCQNLISELKTTKDIVAELHQADIQTTTEFQKIPTPTGRSYSNASSTGRSKSYPSSRKISDKIDETTLFLPVKEQTPQYPNELETAENSNGIPKPNTSGDDTTMAHIMKNNDNQSSVGSHFTGNANDPEFERKPDHRVNDMTKIGLTDTGISVEKGGREIKHLKENLDVHPHFKDIEMQNKYLQQQISKLTDERDSAHNEKSEIEHKLTEIEKTCKGLQDQNGNLTNEVMRLDGDLKDARYLQKKLGEQTESLKMQWNDQRSQNAELKSMNKNLEQENRNLLERFSKVAGEKLTDNNPNIADLSDKNRPTKLGEMYSELYDNEWTDALDGLSAAGHGDNDIVETLKTTLWHAFGFCEQKSDLMKRKIHEAVNLLRDKRGEDSKGNKVNSTMNEGRSKTSMSASKQEFEHWLSREVDVRKMREMWTPKKPISGTKSSSIEKSKRKEVDADSKIRNLKKEIAESVVPIVQEEYLDLYWNKDCVPAMKPYIKKCLFICWMMIVQSPPMCFTADPKPGAQGDTDVYRHYLSSGKYIEYVVWPALKLHKDGPLVLKGVAQMKNTI